MKENPKRRKHKDNPYKLINYEEEKEFLVEFKDGKGEIQRIYISKRIYQEMDTFEKLDLKELNEYDRHIEHSFLYEEQLVKRAIHKPKSVEEKVDEILLNNEMQKAIKELSKIQKNRIRKYYFEEKTLDEIASEEHCTKVAIKYSIDIALKNILKKMQK